jgi:hypothetical protein
MRKEAQDMIQKKIIEGLTQEAESAVGQRNPKRLYDITRTFSG